MRAFLIALVLVGCAGEEGPPGADGEPGASSYRPAVWVACLVSLDIVGGEDDGQDGIKETGLIYTAIEYSNGDVQTQCEAGLGSAESAAGGAYYPAGIPGATERSCIVALDYPPDGSHVGHWVFSSPKGPVVEYLDEDPSHPLDGARYEFGENDCAVKLTDDSGEWSDSSLADLE